MNKHEGYQRLKIHAALTLISELHVGSGNSVETGERTSQRNEDNSSALYDAVCLDDQQQPYLPGSTLRGVLRNLGLSCVDDETWIHQLFGQQPTNGSVSRLRIQDAFIHSPLTIQRYSNSRMTTTSTTLPTRITQGIQIDPIRQVVDAHKLFQFEVIPEGTVFNFVLEGDEIDKDTFLLLCQLLTNWREQRIAIGRNHLKGNGLVDCSITKVEVADQQSINHWLSGERASFYETLEDLPKVDSLPLQHENILSYRFESVGMMLVNDPDRVKNNSDGHSPQHVFAQLENGQAVVSGRAVKGLLRNHARKILATLLANKGVPVQSASKKANQLLNDVFGSSGEASRLSISNALSIAKAPKIRKQAFIAVDRFTGGVKDGALFQTEGVLNEIFAGDIILISRGKAGQLKNDSTCNWWKGLLSFVVRDMMEGDGYLGWGKSRGYGRFVLSQVSVNGQTIQRWEDAVNIVSEAELKQWVISLQDFVSLQAKILEGGKIS